MLSPILILALQALLITLQMLNAGFAALEHINPMITITLSSIIGGLQFFVQHLGNQADPKKGASNGENDRRPPQ